MSIDIGGGVVEVDTRSLRDAAAGLDRSRALIDTAGRCSQEAQEAIVSVPVDPWPIADVAVRADAICETVGALASDLRFAADVYELVELRVRAELVGAGEQIAIDERIRWLDSRSPAAAQQAAGLLDEWRRLGVSDLDVQAAWGTWMPLFGIGVLPAAISVAYRAGVRSVGTGVVPNDARLRGDGDPVSVRRVHPEGARGMPATPERVAPVALADAARRIPSTGAATIRVERYLDGSGRDSFAVYAAGTQSVAMGGDEPLDMRSNLQLYANERSASYDAVVAALRDAGASRGDAVHAFGFSQGAMVAGRLALEGEFDVRSVVSFGSPIEAQVDGDVLSVSVRHTDDPVAALADGGAVVAPGGPGSFVAERLYDASAGAHDLLMPAHRLDAYAETAAGLDASQDPRMEGVREMLAGLGDAEAVEVFEYAAAREVSAASSSPAGAG